MLSVANLSNANLKKTKKLNRARRADQEVSNDCHFTV